MEKKQKATMYHDFWLLQEREYAYTDYQTLVSRHNVPVRLDDEVLHYFSDTLSWIPTLNPAKKGAPMGYGLNWYGPTIINQVGGALFARVWNSWMQLLACGPEQLRLQGAFSWQWLFDESEHIISEDQLHTLGRYEHIEIDRDQLVCMLTTLMQFGEKAATGESFILHLGI